MPHFNISENKIVNYEWINQHINSNHVVVFLHEALGSIGQWKNFPQKLCNELNLPGLVYERIGHGQSSCLTKKRNENYLQEYALKELPIVLNKLLKKNQKAILIGHSDGGSIALLYAQKHKDKLSALVTMAAHVINEKETLRGIEPAVKAFEKGKLDGLKKYHGDKTNSLFYAWANTWSAEFFKDWNICNEIDKVEVDALIIQGILDQYGTERQVDLILENIKSEKKNKLMLDDCGHHPHLEKTGVVIDSIKRFLEA